MSTPVKPASTKHLECHLGRRTGEDGTIVMLNGREWAFIYRDQRLRGAMWRLVLLPGWDLVDRARPNTTSGRTG